MAQQKTRLDDYLVQAGFALDKRDAQAKILAGEVRLQGNPAKAGDWLTDPAQLSFRTPPPFVSRGGEKLRGALEAFQIDPRGKRCLDIGSSTGGFTHCLLNAGAKEIWAVDVGKGLMDIKLRCDPRVHLFEGTHFRHWDAKAAGLPPVELLVVDVSFTSVLNILPTAYALLAVSGNIIALIKPQFESEPREAPKGLVRDEPTRHRIITRTREALSALNMQIKGEADSVITGRAGNQETFFWIGGLPS